MEYFQQTIERDITFTGEPIQFSIHRGCPTVMRLRIACRAMTQMDIQFTPDAMMAVHVQCIGAEYSHPDLKVEYSILWINTTANVSVDWKRLATEKAGAAEWNTIIVSSTGYSLKAIEVSQLIDRLGYLNVDQVKNINMDDGSWTMGMKDDNRIMAITTKYPSKIIYFAPRICPVA